MLSNLIKRNKKKGFTLIELIIVIAILAILAVILIPQVNSYKRSAEKSNIQASAKTIQNAIDAYDADNDTAITDLADAFNKLASGASGASAASAAIDSSNWPTCLKTGSLDDLKKIVNGDFTVTNPDKLNSTIHVNP